MKKRLSVIAAVCFCLLLGVAAAQLRADGVATEPLTVRTKTGAHVFQVEVADDAAELEKGLMFRKEMAEDHGMLFEFPGPPRPVAFWMKNTYIPLDMIFVGPYGDVVHIAENAVPETLTQIPSILPVTGVIEINGGLAAKLGIAAGDKVVHPFFGN